MCTLIAVTIATTMNTNIEDSHYGFQHPLSSRYSSKEMLFNFSDHNRYTTWRHLWYNLAKAQSELELHIPTEALNEMSMHISDPINYKNVETEEKLKLHDVMAHLTEWGRVCPTAKPILHLGATSCDITDNTDCILIKKALIIIIQKLLHLNTYLSMFCEKWKSQPTLGYTHFQSAQLTTVGKRACIWLQDFVSDLNAIQRAHDELLFRGLKGTTGTQASFLALFSGDESQVKRLEKRFSSLSGFDNVYPITGQTTPRKSDIDVLAPLASLAASAHKMCTDIRLLAHSKQLEEPFEETQIGSSAMAYKRNPMKSERVCSLSRYLMTLVGNAYHTAANQWLERSLDDSANRRIIISEGFLCADAILKTLLAIVNKDGISVNPMILNAHIQKEIPFLATEKILMAIVAAGGDRQIAHEHIREMSIQMKKSELENNDLLERIKSDPYFEPIWNEIDDLAHPSLFTGLACNQVEEYLCNVVNPLLSRYKKEYEIKEQIRTRLDV